MAERPVKQKGEATPRKAAERQQDQREERAARGTADVQLEGDDPREEEGWTQPESSAQKGAPPDEG